MSAAAQQLQRIRSMLSTPDVDVVRQALALADAIGEPWIWKALREDLALGEGGALCPSAALARGIGAIHAPDLLVHIAHRTGRLDEAPSLKLSQVTSLQPLARLSRLHTLEITSGAITSLAPLASLTGLTSLSLQLKRYAGDLSPLVGLSRLRTLRLPFCYAMTHIQRITALHALEELDLTGARALRDVRCIRQLAGLRRLSLGGRRVGELSWLTGLQRLESLNLRDGGPIALHHLCALPRLHALNLRDCQVDDLAPLWLLSGLRSLDITGCAERLSVRGLHRLSALEELTTSERLPPALQEIATLSRLRRLSLWFWHSLEDTSALSSLRALEVLWLHGAMSLRDVDGLAALPLLRELTIDVSSRTDLSALRGRTSISVLRLRGCGSLEFLSGMHGLTQLELSDISPPQQLRVLSGLSGLVALTIDGCDMEDVGFLGGLTQLRTLRIFGCTELEDVSALSVLSLLEELAFGGQNEIRDFTPLLRLRRLRRLRLPFGVSDDWVGVLRQRLPSCTITVG